MGYLKYEHFYQTFNYLLCYCPRGLYIAPVSHYTEPGLPMLHFTTSTV